jgi:hypothetical protein
MKIRTGFVSNSSSSSFVIICKGELTEGKLRNALGDVALGFEFGPGTFYNGILDNIEEHETVSVGWYRDIDIPLSQLTKDDIHIYSGSHSDNAGSRISSTLCSTNLSVETDDLKIIWSPR